MNLFSAFLGSPISDAEIRSEIWRLGVRHLGWPLEGALEEIKGSGLSSERAALLRACIRKLQAT